jgi:hypothetical protein
LRTSVFALTTLVTLLSLTTAAYGSVYDWTYGGDGHHSGSGTLTTAGGASPYTITSFSGTFDGAAIDQILDPGECCGAPGSDNLLYIGSGSLLDGNGLGFQSFGDPGFYDILFLNGSYGVLDVNGILTSGGTFTAEEQVGGPGAPAPEPAPQSVIGAGCGCLLLLYCRRKSRRAGSVM